MGYDADSDLREFSRIGVKFAGFEVVALDRVDFSDSTCRITTRTGSGKLTASIDRLGVLVPPLVQPAGDRFRIISGFLRLEACRRLGFETTNVRLIASDSSDLDCARCAIAENGLQRALNPLETARAVALLATAVPGKKRLAAEAMAAGLPENMDMIDKLLQVVDLPAAVQKRLADGTIGLAMALALGRESAAFSTACARIFGELRVGLNRQREILLLMSEIAAREGKAPLDILQNDALAALLADADLDRPHKVNRIRDWLYHRRYPNLAAAEDAFAERRSRLKLGKRIQLKAPRNFESDLYAFYFQFRSVEDIQALLKQIERVSKDPDMKAILLRPEAESSRS